MAPRTARLLPALVVLPLVLAACGSRLDPDEVGLAAGAGAAPGAVATAGPLPAGEGSGVESTTGEAGGVQQGGTTGNGAVSSSSGGAGTSATGGSAATGGVKAGACAGFADQTGVTDDTITIANVSDISGPVPGLMQAAQDAVRAYVAYFNATTPNGICGRKLELLPLDTRTDAGGDQVAYQRACDEAFAAIGSMSAYDSGGAQTAADCRLPDLRVLSGSLQRRSCATCFGTLSLRANEYQNSVPDFVKRTIGAGAQRSAYLYIDAGAVTQNVNYQVAAMTKRGLKFVVKQGIDAVDFNYAPYVQQLKDAKVEFLQFDGAVTHAVRIIKALRQQDYWPKIVMMSQPMYTPALLQEAGSDAEDLYVYLGHAAFEEGSSHPELALYLNWLGQSDPSAVPSSYGVFAWSAARLFVQEATRLGGKLTRASLVDAVSRVGGWTANGLHAPQNVGAKRTAQCWRFLQVHDDAWRPADGTDYHCSGTTVVPE